MTIFNILYVLVWKECSTKQSKAPIQPLIKVNLKKKIPGVEGFTERLRRRQVFYTPCRRCLGLSASTIFFHEGRSAWKAKPRRLQAIINSRLTWTPGGNSYAKAPLQGPTPDPFISVYIPFLTDYGTSAFRIPSIDKPSLNFEYIVTAVFKIHGKIKVILSWQITKPECLLDFFTAIKWKC